MFVKSNLILLVIGLFVFLLFSFLKQFRSRNAFLNLKYRELPNHVERSFFDALKHSSREHGYSGFFRNSRFLFRRLFNYSLQLISKIIPFSGFRILLHRMRGVSVGKGVHIGPSVTIDDVYPNYLVIEDGVSIAGLNFILTHSKPLLYHEKLSKSYVAPVIIKKNAWIAIGVIILPGVTIGEGSIIASGSVVTGDIPDNVFAGGTPAKILKEFEIEDGKPIAFKHK